jgi:hypothetical protein
MYRCRYAAKKRCRITAFMKKSFTVSWPGPVGAVAGKRKVGNEQTRSPKWQSIEYTTSP